MYILIWLCWAENTARQWLGIGGKREWTDIAIDAFGNALGNSVAGSYQRQAGERMSALLQERSMDVNEHYAYQGERYKTLAAGRDVFEEEEEENIVGSQPGTSAGNRSKLAWDPEVCTPDDTADETVPFYLQKRFDYHIDGEWSEIPVTPGRWLVNNVPLLGGMLEGIGGDIGLIQSKFRDDGLVYNYVTGDELTAVEVQNAAVDILLAPLMSFARMGRPVSNMAESGVSTARAVANSEATVELTQVGKYARRGDISYRPANEVNATFPEGWSPPYKPGTRVTEFTTTADDIYVRVHGENNMARSWMMKREAIEGLSPAQIKSKYALPEVPTYLSEVHVPTGTRIRTGTVNPVFGGIGNATQYELLQRLPTTSFRNTVRLGQ